MNQLKQVSTAMTMYTVDNDEVYPSTRFGANGGTHCPANAGLEWHGTAIHATFAYINDASFYICPSRKNPAGFCNPCAAWARALLPRSSYQMSCATRHSAFTTVKQVKRPSDLALFGESRGGNYWRPASDQTGCDTGYLMVHRAGIQYSRFDTSVLWINSSRIHAPKAIVTAYLPWTNVENYQPGW
jgi:hypothetical protein